MWSNINIDAEEYVSSRNIGSYLLMKYIPSASSQETIKQSQVIQEVVSP